MIITIIIQGKTFMSLENPLALNVLPKTSITHLQMSISIKDHSGRVNTWDSN